MPNSVMHRYIVLVYNDIYNEYLGYHATLEYALWLLLHSIWQSNS
jgi:hypothetical protein